MRGRRSHLLHNETQAYGHDPESRESTHRRRKRRFLPWPTNFGLTLTCIQELVTCLLRCGMALFIRNSLWRTVKQKSASNAEKSPWCRVTPHSVLSCCSTFCQACKHASMEYPNWDSLCILPTERRMHFFRFRCSKGTWREEDASVPRRSKGMRSRNLHLFPTQTYFQANFKALKSKLIQICAEHPRRRILKMTDF